MRRELLMAHGDLMEASKMRFAFSPFTQFKINKNSYRDGRKLDVVEINMLALLGMGKCMTARQLKAYLLLKGYDIDMDVLNERLRALIEEGIIVEAVYVRNDDEQHCTLKAYMAAYKANDLLKGLGAAMLDPREDYAAGNQMGRRLAICSCLLWNQVILNQLLYNQGVGNFRLWELVQVEKKQSISIPLGIFVKGKFCVFDMLRSYHDPELVRQRLKMWEDYAEARERSFVLVIVCESVEHEQWIAGCIKDFSSDWISLATCTEDKWLYSRPGTMNLRNVTL